MKEREYIDATNLAKIRTAKTIIHDTLEMDDEEKADRLAALEALRRWEARLEKTTKTRG